MNHKRARREPLIHPLLGLLLLAVVFAAAARYYETPRDRQAALRRGHQSGARVPTPTPEPTPEETETPVPLVFDEPVEQFEDWFLDELTNPRICAFDATLKDARRLEIRKERFENGMDLLMSVQDVAFVAWTAFSYDLNPHFLLGIMMTESAGDCSAVSYAGAQGCFQITYRQGAGQLRNSFPERVASWYWAKRSNVGPERFRRPGEALGYWPTDLYIAPEVYFGKKLKKGTRQLRMTVDPVATLQTSDRAGDTEVSSVANFSFGVIGAGLYFHFLNHYLYSHEAQLKGDVRALVNDAGKKVAWMAASYNQGAPRSMRQLGNYGAQGMWRQVAPEVQLYADTVSDYCTQLQLGDETYGGKMTWGQFSDWLQQLRWTYSEVPVDWEKVMREVQARHFPPGHVLEVETELLEVFRTMMALDAHLKPEKPRIDHRVRF